MAFVSIAAPARGRLAAIKGVTIIDQPLPHEPADIALIFAGIRNYTIRAEGDGFSASFHIGAGEHLPLANGVTKEGAFGAVLAHIALIGHLPPVYSPATDAAERAAAAEVLAAFSPMSLAVAA